MSAGTFGLRLQKYGCLALLMASVGLLLRPAAGQAIVAGTRTLDFDVFGGVADFKLDTGSAYDKYSTGFAVGADATRRFRRFDVSLQPRFERLKASMYDDTETVFMGNLVLSKQFRKFHVYGFGGIGYGKVNYQVAGFQDNSVVYAVGPGLQYDLPFHLAIKGDWQYQRWKVGTETSGFNPNGFTVSAVYRISLHR